MDESDAAEINMKRWMEEQEMLLNPINYELKCVERIPIHVVFVSKTGMVVEKKTVVAECCVLETHSIVKWKSAIPAISEIYELMDVRVFHVDIQKEQVSMFCQLHTNGNENIAEKKGWWKPIERNSEEYRLNSSIGVFHSLSAIYVFVKERAETVVSGLKSILKQGDRKGCNTKKVRIAPNEEMAVRISASKLEKRRHTRKRVFHPPLITPILLTEKLALKENS